MTSTIDTDKITKIDRKIGIADALESLSPGSKWTVSNNNYSEINWLDNNKTKPTEQDCLAEVARLQAAYNALEYQRLRAPEYPPITDYLDAVVKNDQAQIDAYIAACKAVKEKYPKNR
jgi:hypothetical protein